MYGKMYVGGWWGGRMKAPGKPASAFRGRVVFYERNYKESFTVEPLACTIYRPLPGSVAEPSPEATRRPVTS